MNGTKDEYEEVGQYTLSAVLKTGVTPREHTAFMRLCRRLGKNQAQLLREAVKLLFRKYEVKPDEQYRVPILEKKKGGDT